MQNNEVDLLTYFDAKFSALKEYFDEKFKNMDEKFNDMKSCQEGDIDVITNKLNDHENRLVSLENTEGTKARDFIKNIKDNVMRYAVPSLIILFVYLLGTGEILKILGINR